MSLKRLICVIVLLFSGFNVFSSESNVIDKQTNFAKYTPDKLQRPLSSVIDGRLPIAALVHDKKVIVIPTKTVTQGISAVINYVPALSIEDNTHEMTEAAKEIRTCEITYAIRDTEIDGKQVHTGDYMGIGDGHMLAVGTERVQTAIDAVKAMVDEDSELLTIYYGADASEDEATEIADLLEEDDAFADIDIEVVYGGQPVYYYIISAE